MNSVAAKSNTIEVNGVTSSNIKEQQKKYVMHPYCSCVFIQVSISPDIQIPLEMASLHQVLSLNVGCDPGANLVLYNVILYNYVCPKLEKTREKLRQVCFVFYVVICYSGVQVQP